MSTTFLPSESMPRMLSSVGSVMSVTLLIVARGTRMPRRSLTVDATSARTRESAPSKEALDVGAVVPTHDPLALAFVTRASTICWRTIWP